MLNESWTYLILQIVMENAYAVPVSDVLKHFHTNEELGLSDEQVAEAQEKHGPNGKFVF